MHQANVRQHCYQHLVNGEVLDDQELQSLQEKMYRLVEGYKAESQLWKELEVQELVEDQLLEVRDCDGLLGLDQEDQRGQDLNSQCPC